MHTAYQVTESNATRIVVTVPGWSMFLGWTGLLIAFILVVAVFTTSRTVRRVMAYDRSAEQLDKFVSNYRLAGLGITAGGLLLLVVLGYSSGSIVLDRKIGVAVMRSKMTGFLPSQTLSMPLQDVESASLDSKPNSRRIHLFARSGHDIGFPLWSDRPGQQEAVDAINGFLGVSR